MAGLRSQACPNCQLGRCPRPSPHPGTWPRTRAISEQGGLQRPVGANVATRQPQGRPAPEGPATPRARTHRCLSLSLLPWAPAPQSCPGPRLGMSAVVTTGGLPHGVSAATAPHPTAPGTPPAVTTAGGWPRFNPWQVLIITCVKNSATRELLPLKFLLFILKFRGAKGFEDTILPPKTQRGTSAGRGDTSARYEQECGEA